MVYSGSCGQFDQAEWTEDTQISQSVVFPRTYKTPCFEMY